MNKKLLVINTLVFLNQLQDGVPQCEMLDTIHRLGVEKAEVRREFIKDFSVELVDIKKKAGHLGMELFYSVPDVLYKNGELQYETMEIFFKEAFAMGCSNVKMNIGNYHSVTLKDVSMVTKLCDQYLVKLTIENDQTEENGRISKIASFIEMFQQLGGKITVTFDIGNWIWQKEDPMENAKKLKENVTYIHLKDVLGKENPKAVFLNEGDLPWKSILQQLPQDVPLALEYPCGDDAANQLVRELDKLLEFNVSKI